VRKRERTRGHEAGTRGAHFHFGGPAAALDLHESCVCSRGPCCSRKLHWSWPLGVWLEPVRGAPGRMSVCMGQPHATLHTHDDGGAAKAAREVKQSMIVCGTPWDSETARAMRLWRWWWWWGGGGFRASFSLFALSYGCKIGRRHISYLFGSGTAQRSEPFFPFRKISLIGNI
jgi:hypothetical protein